MKNLTFSLIGLLAVVMFLSSCASVFEARNYSHLNYVKAKKDREETLQTLAGKPEKAEEMKKIISPQEKISIAQPAPEPKALQQRSEQGTSSSQIQSVQKPQSKFHPEDIIISKLEPLLSEKQQKKIESKTSQLFGDLDHDLRLALLFGIAGLIALLIGALLTGAPPAGEIFYTIGAILFIIGLVYLIMYIVNNG